MSSRTRSILTPTLAAAILAVAVPTGVASAAPTTSASGAGAIVAPVVDRLLLADAVARSKWVTRSPIDDPVRERAVIDGAVAGASPASADRVRAGVRDQIEASKTVQRGLFAGWRAAPSTAPRAASDLTATRGRISALTSDIAARIADRDPHDPSCRADVASATLHVVVDRGLTPLQTVALVQAERSVCGL
ncbi:gamma subclass chorismate mutase AroQ [Williamsia sp. MIQD14]|uniref:gamma subclass chorismate mutase AroQ n=1 Tax=Williamsia sp. MIQD14 TaxID=3425703 RepID=UPI003DA05C83